MTIFNNDLGERFKSNKGRRELIRAYGDSKNMFCGKNEDGEDVCLSISHAGITLKTNQSNGWVRVNYYDENGVPAGEGFDGRWK